MVIIIYNRRIFINFVDLVQCAKTNKNTSYGMIGFWQIKIEYYVSIYTEVHTYHMYLWNLFLDL